MEVIYKEESYRIMGACFEVHREMGCGFLEAVYQECLEIEFGIQGIPFRPQIELGLMYKGRVLEQGDWSLLDAVRGRPRMWRDIDGV